MGQRTQILLNIVDKKNDVNEVYMIHDQWGIGRVMPYDILNFLSSITYKKPYNAVLKDFIREKFLSSRYDVSDEIRMLPDRKYFDMHDLDNVKEIFSNQDNNNGGAVVKVDLVDDYNFETTIGYLQGYEESNKPFTKYIEPCKWILSTWGDYKKGTYVASMDFFKGYKNICKSYGIEHIIGTTDNFTKTMNLKTYYKTFKEELDK